MAVSAFIFVVLEFIIYKGFGKKAFLLAFVHWLSRIFRSNKVIQTMLIKQNEEIAMQRELIYSILVKMESVENEVKFNGGKYRLKDAVKDILYNQGVYSSEREASLYIDPQPIFKTNEVGKVTFVNAAWLEMVGCTDEEEMLGMGWMAAVPEESRDLAEKTSERFKNSPSPFHGGFVYKHLKTGVLIKTNVRTQLIRDGNGKFIGTLGTVQVLSDN